MTLRCLCCDKHDERFVCVTCGNQQLASFRAGGAIKGLRSALAKAMESRQQADALRRRVLKLRGQAQAARARVDQRQRRVQAKQAEVGARQQEVGLRRRELQRLVSTSSKTQVTWREFFLDPRPDQHRLPTFHPMRELVAVGATLAAERRARCLDLVHCYPLTKPGLPRDLQRTWWVHVLRGLAGYLDVALPFPPEALPGSAFVHPLRPGAFHALLKGNVQVLAQQQGVGATSDSLATLRAILSSSHCGCLHPPEVAVQAEGDDWTLVEEVLSDVDEDKSPC